MRQLANRVDLPGPPPPQEMCRRKLTLPSRRRCLASLCGPLSSCSRSVGPLFRGAMATRRHIPTPLGVSALSAKLENLSARPSPFDVPELPKPIRLQILSPKVAPISVEPKSISHRAPTPQAGQEPRKGASKSPSRSSQGSSASRTSSSESALSELRRRRRSPQKASSARPRGHTPRRSSSPRRRSSPAPRSGAGPMDLDGVALEEPLHKPLSYTVRLLQGPLEAARYEAMAREVVQMMCFDGRSFARRCDDPIGTVLVRGYKIFWIRKTVLAACAPHLHGMRLEVVKKDLIFKSMATPVSRASRPEATREEPAHADHVDRARTEASSGSSKAARFRAARAVERAPRESGPRAGKRPEPSQRAPSPALHHKAPGANPPKSSVPSHRASASSTLASSAAPGQPSRVDLRPASGAPQARRSTKFPDAPWAQRADSPFEAPRPAPSRTTAPTRPSRVAAAPSGPRKPQPTQKKASGDRERSRSADRVGSLGTSPACVSRVLGPDGACRTQIVFNLSC